MKILLLLALEASSESPEGTIVLVLCNFEFGTANAYCLLSRRQRTSRLNHAVGEAILFPFLLARVGLIAVGVIALAAACAPPEPPTLTADKEPAVALVSARP